MDFCQELNYNFSISLNTPEEIAKWREDRRKNYPKVNKERPENQSSNSKPAFHKNGHHQHQNHRYNHQEKRGFNQNHYDNHNMRGGRGRGRGGGGRGRGRGRGRGNFRAQAYTPRQNHSYEIEHRSTDAGRREDAVELINEKLVASNAFSTPCASTFSRETHSSVSSNPPSVGVGSLQSLASAYASSDEDSDKEEGEIVEKESITINISHGIAENNEQLAEAVGTCLQNVIDKVTLNVENPSALLNENEKSFASNSKRQNVDQVINSKQVKKMKPNQKRHTTNKVRREKLTLFEKLLLEDVKREEDKIIGIIEALVVNNFFH